MCTPNKNASHFTATVGKSSCSVVNWPLNYCWVFFTQNVWDLSTVCTSSLLWLIRHARQLILQLGRSQLVFVYTLYIYIYIYIYIVIHAQEYNYQFKINSRAMVQSCEHLILQGTSRNGIKTTDIEASGAAQSVPCKMTSKYKCWMRSQSMRKERYCVCISNSSNLHLAIC